MAFIPPMIAAVTSAVSSAGAALGIGSATAGVAAGTGVIGTGIAGASSLAGVSAATAAGISTGLAGGFSAATLAAYGIPVAAAATPWLSVAGVATSVIGTGVQMAAQAQAAEASRRAAMANKAIAEQNAQIAKQNASIAGQSGAQQAAIQSQKTRALAGSMKANMGAAGIDINTGSAYDVLQSNRELGHLDALTVRSNAAREAYGYKTQEINYLNEGAVRGSEAENAEASGVVNAAGTFLGGLGDATDKYYRYKLSGGLSG